MKFDSYARLKTSHLSRIVFCKFILNAFILKSFNLTDRKFLIKRILEKYLAERTLKHLVESRREIKFV